MNSSGGGPRRSGGIPAEAGGLHTCSTPPYLNSRLPAHRYCSAWRSFRSPMHSPRAGKYCYRIRRRSQHVATGAGYDKTGAPRRWQPQNHPRPRTDGAAFCRSFAGAEYSGHQHLPAQSQTHRGIYS